MMKSNNAAIKPDQISTDDLAFSAFLKMKGYPIIKLNQNKSKSTFTFNVNGEDANALKMAFVNSEFLNYYNELKNLKKLL